MSRKKTWNREKKNEWRRNFWEYVDATMPRELREFAHVVILPGAEGLELPFIVDQCGIPQENIHAVDHSASLIATAKWRKTYPGVRCYGVSLGAAIRRINAELSGDHRLRVLNLDFCTNLTAELVDELSTVGQFTDFAAGAIVQINVLKGRESPLVPVLLAQLGYESRSEWLLEWLIAPQGNGPGACIDVATGQYQDGSSPMQWARGFVLGDGHVSYRGRHVHWKGYEFGWYKDTERHERAIFCAERAAAEYPECREWGGIQDWLSTITKSRDAINAKSARIYHRNQGGSCRYYGDFRHVGGGRDALIPEGETRATTDKAIAAKLYADKLSRRLEAA